MALQSTPSGKEKKSIYDVAYSSIFFRNFLQGFARGLGAITAYLFLGGLIYYLAVSFVLPRLKNVLNTNLPLITPSIQLQPNNPSNSESVSPPNSPGISAEDLESALELLQKQEKGQ